MTLRQSPASSSKPVAALVSVLLTLLTGAAFAQSTNQEVKEVKVPDWVAIEANIPYDAHPQTVLDVLRPKAASAGQRPGVIMFHGGSWLRTSKESMTGSFCLPYLKHGFVVCNVEYRLSPVAKAPAAVNDALKAAKWFFDHAAQYGVDTNRIVVTGASAGSHLGMMAGMATEAAKLGPVITAAAIVNCYGVTDVADLLAGPHKKSWAGQWLPEQDGRMELARRVSPLTYARKELPPVLTVHGGSDTTVPTEQALRLTEALRAAGAETELLVVTNAKHGFTREEWHAVHERIFRFLAERGLVRAVQTNSMAKPADPAVRAPDAAQP
jgi:acetyl esterase/lipase